MDDTKHYSEEAIISGIQCRDNDVLTFVYREFYPVISRLVRNNNGTEHDAEDIFQDGIVVIFDQLQNGGLELNCSFKTYFYSVCRNLWMQILEKKKKWELGFDDNISFVHFKQDYSRLSYELQREKLFQKHFLSLSQSCRKVLLLMFSRVPSVEIARIMGYRSGQYARKRKSQCRKILVRRIYGDPIFKKLKNHEI
jgi:RNA polymerase sigma factor (sigma-70 family)